MKNRALWIFSTLFLWALADAQSEVPTDGQWRDSSAGEPMAWDALASEWVNPESFWLRYAERHGGLTWGRRTDYPPYAAVSELDTMIIELDSGPCMMQFFHTRWRRANDVRRWDDAFNGYAGCPHVFD